jgi:DNA invertase Pin-like site-specific DNA recombinase
MDPRGLRLHRRWPEGRADDARRRKLDLILVWKLDRWGRSVADAVNTIQELSGVGVSFLAVTQGIGTEQSNPMSRFMLTIMAAFAELERELITERVHAGIRAAKARGKHCGRPKRIFRRDVAQEMRERGMSWRKIAAELGVPQSTIRLALSVQEPSPDQTVKVH